MNNENNQEDFFSLNNIINNNKKIFYQVQADQGDNYVKIIFMGIFNYFPTTVITKFTLNDFECIIMSYVITSEEIQNNNFRLIGCIIKKDNKIISSLDYIFIPNNELTNVNNLESENRIKGKFKIVLNNKDNNKIIIKEFDEYSGREESVYVLTDCIGNYLCSL